MGSKSSFVMDRTTYKRGKQINLVNSELFQGNDLNSAEFGKEMIDETFIPTDYKLPNFASNDN